MSWEPWADPRHERVHFVGRDLAIGRLELAADDPSFADTGPTRHHVVVFPEIPVWLDRSGGETEVADPRRVIFHNAGVPYRRRAITGGDRSWWIALRRVEPVVGAGCGRDRPFEIASAPLPAARLLELHRILDRLGRERPAVAERRIRGLVRVLLAPESPPPSSCAEAHRALAERARARIGECYREAVTVPRIAADVAASAAHLSRIFRRASGQTLQDFRDDLRLRQALVELRRRPGRDLTRLGLALGYSSHSHFTAAFRRRFGCPPSAVLGFVPQCGVDAAALETDP